MFTTVHQNLHQSHDSEALLLQHPKHLLRFDHGMRGSREKSDATDLNKLCGLLSAQREDLVKDVTT